MKKVYEKLSNKWTSDSIRIINTPSMIAKNTFFYIQEIGTFLSLPGYYAERANLPSYLILYTISGEGELIYNGEKHYLREKDLLWIDCRKHHSYKELSGDWKFIWVHIYGSTISEYYSIFEKNTGVVFGVNQEIEDEIKAKHKQLMDLSTESSLTNELKISSIICEMITLLCMNSLNYATDSKVNITESVPTVIKSIAIYVEENYAKEISLDHLEDIFFISKYYISREFKRYMGIGIWDYLTGLRLNYAKEQLRDTSDSISNIATSCGIPNVSHFINVFKTREGVTPLVYRKLWQ